MGSPSLLYRDREVTRSVSMVMPDTSTSAYTLLILRIALAAPVMRTLSGDAMVLFLSMI